MTIYRWVSRILHAKSRRVEAVAEVALIVIVCVVCIAQTEQTVRPDVIISPITEIDVGICAKINTLNGLARFVDDFIHVERRIVIMRVLCRCARERHSLHVDAHGRLARSLVLIPYVVHDPPVHFIAQEQRAVACREVIVVRLGFLSVWSATVRIRRGAPSPLSEYVEVVTDRHGEFTFGEASWTMLSI